MVNRSERNYFLDISLFITGFACLITGILLHLRPEFSISALTYIRPLHIWIGYVMAAVIVVHLLLHSDWIASLTKRIGSDKKKVVILISIILISLITCYAAAVWGPDTQHGKGQNRGKQKGYTHNQSNNSLSFPK
ncbi:DUF4405 domain-containing protein [Syntrophaceticus schinkii]|uniref:DUF4405 domain-containing protein n=1 Tax=Syntrophaceticus schinkii TaxID=499207 RepID=UPI0005CBFD5F